MLCSFPARITSPLPRVVTKIQDLYLSGQDVTTGGWLPAVMSGALAASQILGYNPLDPCTFGYAFVCVCVCLF